MSGPWRPADRRASVRPHGFGLVELMVALATGAFVIGGAVAIYVKARDVLAALDATARLQETARLAMAVIEADVRMAGYWGLAGPAVSITASESLVFPGKCGGAAWLTSTPRFIDGTNNAYLAAGACAASAGGHRSGTDVLVLRRASAERITPQSATVSAPNQDRVLIVTNRSAGQIFVPQDLGNDIPAGYATQDVAGQPPRADTREFIVHAYYVSANSSVAAGYPALRRKGLTAGPDIRDEEMVAGVEDLQFQLGVDTTGDSGADLFVNPGEVPAGARPVSVRIWLRLRAQERDNAYVDDQAATYADRTVAASGDSFRRVLISQTVHLRNAPS